MKIKKDSPADVSDLIKSANLFPVVGVGASAGGLDAFKKLVKAIPPKSGMAFVLVQHLHPGHDSFLPEILQKDTPVPVVEITDDIKVLPDHIYIIPSNKILIATDGVLMLEPRPEKIRNVLNLPIDLFFRSLAEVHQKHAIGVVLSGTGFDGTVGLKAIEKNGGLTFVQDSSATYNDMPQSAVNAGVVDYVLSPEAIIQKLVELKKTGSFNDEREREDPKKIEDNSYRKIINQLRLRKGTDFTFYKETTIRRRIERRIGITETENLATYLTLVLENEAEQDALYQDLLIPVTAFFRDQKVFNNLSKVVFPEITKNKIPGEPARIWIAGCSTGQEAYSIAMCFHEFLHGAEGKLQIFATDISDPAIIKARHGVYTEKEMTGVSLTRIKKFFTPNGKDFQVNKTIRDMCIFAPHNFLKDPPYGKIDLVSCRNVLIYFQPGIQKKALISFHYALNPQGFLLLGKSETCSIVPEHFTSIETESKLFTRKEAPGRSSFARQVELQQPTPITLPLKKEIQKNDFQAKADEIFLKKYSPAGVIVNEAMEIVEFRGNTANYLEQGSGKPSHNLMVMAKNGLGFELRNLLHKIKKSGEAATKENIPLQNAKTTRLVSIEGCLLPATTDPHYLIVFHETNVFENTDNKTASKLKTRSSKIQDEKQARIAQLEDELLAAREDMRSITEEQESANEELQSANEELMSNGEELQSLNEELETSKEELTSSNEELTSMNAEIVNLNEQSKAALEYTEAIIATLLEPLLVLDAKLRVKTANEAFYKTFGVNPKETEGSLIYDLGNKQWDIPKLRSLLEEILPEKSIITDFEVRHYFPTIGDRVMLLNARQVIRAADEDKIILLAIRDVTEQHRQQLKEKAASDKFRNLVLQAPVAICILKGENYVTELANDYYLKIVDRGEDFIEQPLFEILPELKSQGIKKIMDNVMETGVPYYGNEVEVLLKRNKREEQAFFNFVYQPVHELGVGITGIIAVANEVTEQVIFRKKIEAQAGLVRELMMTAPGFVATLRGPDYVFELVNERYQSLFGKRKIEGKPFMKAFPELAGQGFDTLLDKVYTTGEPYLGIDIPATITREENGEPELRYFNFSYQAMYDENGKIYSILIFGYEVTDQVVAKNKIIEIQHSQTIKLEEKVEQRTHELNISNNILKQKNEELSSFNFISSHDLQEPLRKIRAFSSLLVDKESHTLSPSGIDHLERINRSAARMQTLIDDLLLYSRTDIQDRKFEKVDLDNILEKVKIDLFELIEEKKAIIKSSAPGEVYVNISQFSQVLNNLIGNSLKFSVQGRQLRITIKAERKKGIKFGIDKLLPAVDYCHISINDNGIGFKPQYNELIFGVFQRLSGKDEYPGTGIGLAIVKKIVENHNGYITAEGEEGKGATFNIYIPTSAPSI